MAFTGGLGSPVTNPGTGSNTASPQFTGTIPNTPPGTPGSPGTGAEPPSQSDSAASPSSSASSSNVAARAQGVQAHHAFLLLIAEACFVGVLSIYASQNKSNRKTALGLIGILWLVFLMANYQTLDNWLKGRGI